MEKNALLNVQKKGLSRSRRRRRSVRRVYGCNNDRFLMEDCMILMIATHYGEQIQGFIKNK